MKRTLCLQLFDDMTDFCQNMINELALSGVLGDLGEIDHACYRVATVSRYELLKNDLAHAGAQISEAFVNGRPIAVYKLTEPLAIGHGRVVDLLELPAPKIGANYQDGFEHIEAVTKDSLEAFMARHPALKFDTSNLRAPVNRDVSVRFAAGLVKFHESSLEHIIAQEAAAILCRPGPAPVVVVDFDDTLISSKEPFLRAVQRALEKFLGHAVPYEEVLRHARPTFPEFFAAFGIGERTSIARVISLFQEEWTKEVARCTIPVGIASLLSCLRSEGVRVIVWTARDRKTTRDFMSSAGFDRFIDRVFAFGDLGDIDDPGKPMPSAELTAAVAGARGVLIGDSVADARAAESLGFPFLQATWVHHAKLPAENARTCATPLDALRAAIGVLHG